MAYGIRDIRKNSIFDQYGQGMDDMSMDYGSDSYGIRPLPPPEPYEVTPPKELFGREPVPSMYGPGETIAPQASSGQAGMGAPRTYDYRDTLGLIDKTFTPDFTDRDRLRKLMDAAPEREAPSFARALVAGALSQKAADPVATSEAVMYAPHRRNMADWTAKADPFYKTAELENRQNINERTLTSNVINADTQARRIEENARQADQKQEVARTRAEADMIRARAIEYKNRGATVTKAGSRLIATFPDGRTMDVGKSGLMDREEELILIGKNQLAVAQAAGAQWARDPDGNWVQVNARTPNATPPPVGSVPITGSGSSGKGADEMSVTDTIKMREESKLRLRDTDKEVYEDTELKGGKVVMKAPVKEGWIFGDSQATIDARRKRTADKLWAIENGVGDPRNKGKGKGGVYTNKYGEQTPYEDEEGPDPYGDLEEGVNPPPVTQRGVATGIDAGRLSTFGTDPTAKFNTPSFGGNPRPPREAAPPMTPRAAPAPPVPMFGGSAATGGSTNMTTTPFGSIPTKSSEPPPWGYLPPPPPPAPPNRGSQYLSPSGGASAIPSPEEMAYLGATNNSTDDELLAMHSIQMRAIDFLKSRNPPLAVNKENIAYAIKKGDVR